MARPRETTVSCNTLNMNDNDHIYCPRFIKGDASRPCQCECHGPALIDEPAYCVRCGRDDLPYGMLCQRDAIRDLGWARNLTLEPARYEGRCIRCCSHNHA